MFLLLFTAYNNHTFLSETTDEESSGRFVSKSRFKIQSERVKKLIKGPSADYHHFMFLFRFQSNHVVCLFSQFVL